MKIDGTEASCSEGEIHLASTVNALPSTNGKLRPAEGATSLERRLSERADISRAEPETVCIWSCGPMS